MSGPRRRSARRLGTLLAGVALAGAVGGMLSGCSQVSALAPVGGDAITEVRYGAIDVLLDRGVDVLEAPVCTAAADGLAVSCAGSTSAGDPIAVTSSTSADAQLVVTVGSETLYSGSLQQVIDEAARG